MSENRPFIWHVWDGERDGFSALVNYHHLNAWIDTQQKLNESGEAGAERKLIAAQRLKRKLELILEGEPPYDIYVRWKSDAQQPMGWEPDLDDGVRLNIRPFMTADVLRRRPNVKWGVDRGKNPDGSVRDNDRHLTLTEKRAARARAGL